MTVPIESHRFYPPALVGDRGDLNGLNGQPTQVDSRSLRIVDPYADSFNGVVESSNLIDPQDSEDYWESLGIDVSGKDSSQHEVYDSEVSFGAYLTELNIKYIEGAQIEPPSVLDHDSFLHLTLDRVHTDPAAFMELITNTDLAGMSHEDIVTLLDNTARFAARASIADFKTNKANSRVAYDLSVVRQVMADFSIYTAEKLEANNEAFLGLTQRYAEADNLAMQEIAYEGLEGEAAQIRRMARRSLAVQSGTDEIKMRVNTDADLTLTTTPDGQPEKAELYLCGNVPTSAPAEEYLDLAGRDKFDETYVLYWHRVLTGLPHIFEEAGRGGRVPLRPGVNRLFGAYDTTVVSANFGHFLKGVLEQVPNAQKAKVVAVWPYDVRATMKKEVLYCNAMEDTETPIFFIGDGGSDAPVVDALEVLSGAFAKRGLKFAEQLAEVNAPFLTYDTIDDVVDYLDRIKQECQMLQQRA